MRQPRLITRRNGWGLVLYQKNRMPNFGAYYKCIRLTRFTILPKLKHLYSNLLNVLISGLIDLGSEILFRTREFSEFYFIETKLLTTDFPDFYRNKPSSLTFRILLCSSQNFLEPAPHRFLF